MSLLLESIRYENGEFCNLQLHEARMQQSIKANFGIQKTFNLIKILSPPVNLKNGRYKCRIVYDKKIKSVDFGLYKRKKITAIKLVVDEKISYSYKFEDRECINQHSQNLKKGQELIFVKKGLLRDASYSNIALWNGAEWHTPRYPLLKGTKRAKLLNKKLIKSKIIRPEDLKNYRRISFINALNELDELSLIL